MASQRAIRAGRAFVELFADNKALVAGLRSAQQRLDKFGREVARIGRSVMVAGAAVLAPITASARIFASMGDNVAKMARRTGLSVEALSELQYAAELSGVSVSDLEVSLRRMQRSIYDAGRGLSTATDALGKLNLSFEELDGLAPEEQFKLIADRLAQVSDPTTRAALAMTLFGRSGSMMLPLIEKGAAGINELQEAARRLGLTISTEDAQAAEKFTDEMTKMWKVVRVAVFQVGASLAPTMIDLVGKIQDAAGATARWIRENRELFTSYIVRVARIAAYGLAIGGVAMAIGKVVAATKIAIAAFSFLAAHPVVGTIVAITAAASALAYTLNRLQVHTAQLTDAMTRERIATQESLRVDKAKADRLRDLAQKQKLTTAEMDEAEWLSRELSKSYGDLGIAIDRTTGTINGMADAYERLTNAMQQTMVAAIDKQIQELGHNIRELRREAVSLSKSFLGGLRIGRIEKLNERILELERQRRFLRKERRAVAGGDLGLLSTGTARRARATGGGMPGGALPAERQQDRTERLQDRTKKRWLVQQMRRVQDLAVELRLEGRERAQAELDLARQRALADMPYAGGEFWVNLEYDLRQQLLDADVGEAITQAVEQATGIRGTFGTEALNRLGLGSDIDRQQLDELTEIRRNTRRLVEAGGPVFAQ